MSATQSAGYSGFSAPCPRLDTSARSLALLLAKNTIAAITWHNRFVISGEINNCFFIFQTGMTGITYVNLSPSHCQETVIHSHHSTYPIRPNTHHDELQQVA
jgi:hypothetical protein